jgi:hypothetical protein
LIESTNGFFRDRAIGVVDERKAARPASLTIDGKHDGCRFADGGEMHAQLCLRRRVRQVADKQAD